MDRRRFLKAAAVAPFAIALGTSAHAQAWPTRNITMIVAFPPGGQADLAARPVALALEKILGRSVVVDNRAGAGGMLGNAAAARAEPDGHTLLMALSSMTFLPEAERLYDKKPSYELDHLVPIARVLADPGVLCVRSDSPYKTLADLVADAKNRPGQISFSSSGNYGAAHVPFEMFQQAAASSCCTCRIAAAVRRLPRSSASRSISPRRRRVRSLRMCRAAPPGCWRAGAPSARPSMPTCQP
jgi:tripartite-type tricarboxylate transporter receptor subunit TctC